MKSSRKHRRINTSSSLIKAAGKHGEDNMVKLKDGGVASGSKPKERMDRKSRLVDLKNAGEISKGNPSDPTPRPTSEFPGFKEGGKAKKWIGKMDLKKGAMSAQAKKAGESTHEFAEKHKDAEGKTGKRARLALTFEKMRHK